MDSIECSKCRELLEQLKDVQRRVNLYSLKKENLTKAIEQSSKDVEVLKERKALIESAKQYYLKVVDLCYMHSIKEMEDFVNHVLGYVFYDESYRIRHNE